MDKFIKYSILIPTRNGIKYLPFCVDSILLQDYSDFELIVSDNHSIDGTWEYLKGIHDDRVSIIKPQYALSMTDHFEWLLSHATGEWIIFLGDDDGLQPYFFKLADYLIIKANLHNIKVINSRRAYFFWKGCEKFYGKTAISYSASDFLDIKNAKLQSLLTLLSFNKDYFALPQMYTTSLFNREVVFKTKFLQDGHFYNSITPDANGAAVVCSLNEKYLHCEIPLGWVGSSPKSTGFSGLIYFGESPSIQNEEDVASAKDFIALSKKSNIKWNESAGDVSLNSFTILYWESILQTQKLQSSFMKKLYNSKFFKTMMFAGVLNKISKNSDTVENRTNKLKDLILLHHINYLTINIFSILLSLLHFIINIKRNKINRLITNKTSISLNVDWENNMSMNLCDASKLIEKLTSEDKIIEKFIQNSNNY